MIIIPDGLEVAGDAYAPEVQRLYWLEKALLAPHDPENSRPCVVLDVPDDGDVVIVSTRSSTDGYGVPHPRQPSVGLRKDGWFSRIQPVQAPLWTPKNARSIDLVLDQSTFAAVRRMAGL